MAVFYKKKKNQLSYKILGPDPITPKIDHLKIDGLAITLAIPSLEERKSLDKKLGKMAKDNNFATWAKKMGYRNGHRVFIKDGDFQGSPDQVTFTVHTDPYYTDHNYLRVGFNPSKVPSYFIKEHMNILLNNGYARLMADGKVTVWDEAIDLHYCELKDLYLYFPKFQYSMTLKKSGNILSEYLGDTGGEKYFCIYNKTQEVKEASANFFHDYLNAVFEKEPVPEYPIMRIELRQNLKKGKNSVLDTKNLPNHFLNLKIHNRWSLEKDETLKTDSARMVFKLFLDCCNFKGLQQARLQLTPDWRKKLAPILAKHKAEWWKPDKVISQRAKSIEDIVNPKPIPKKYEKFFNGLQWFCNSSIE